MKVFMILLFLLFGVVKADEGCVKKTPCPNIPKAKVGGRVSLQRDF
ncbi:hypothetical protein [Thermocrinis sp.]